MRRTGIRAIVAVVLCINVGCSSSIPDTVDRNALDDNVVQFDRVLTELFSQIDDYLIPDIPVYYIIEDNSGIARQFFDNRFYSFLLEREKEVYQAGSEYVSNLPNPDSRGNAVNIALQKMRVDYRYENEKSAVKKLSRTVTVQVSCTIVDVRDGKVRTAVTLDKFLKDTIREEDISFLHNDVLPFTEGILEEEKHPIRELLELGTVLTTAGIIIYLLFSTRSS
ncbi:hypothetical protein ACFL6I_08815 [candidate division KSB1 bacterium]